MCTGHARRQSFRRTKSSKVILVPIESRYASLCALRLVSVMKIFFETSKNIAIGLRIRLRIGRLLLKTSLFEQLVRRRQYCLPSLLRNWPPELPNSVEQSINSINQFI